MQFDSHKSTRPANEIHAEMFEVSLAIERAEQHLSALRILEQQLRVEAQQHSLTRKNAITGQRYKNRVVNEILDID